MAVLTIAQEERAILEAIQTLTGTGQPIVSFNVDGIAVQYAATQLPMLEKRLSTLHRQLTIRNSRKRTTSDFSGGGSDDYLNA